LNCSVRCGTPQVQLLENLNAPSNTVYGSMGAPGVLMWLPCTYVVDGTIMLFNYYRSVTVV